MPKPPTKAAAWVSTLRSHRHDSKDEIIQPLHLAVAVSERGVRAAHARFNALVVVDRVVVLREDGLVDLLQNLTVSATGRRDRLQFPQEADRALQQFIQPFPGYQSWRSGHFRELEVCCGKHKHVAELSKENVNESFATRERE
nr:hypothetical protein CFP56_78592 [Quercus suber]